MTEEEVSPVRHRRLSATEMVTLYGVSPYQGASEHQVYLDHVHPEARATGKERPPLWQRLGTVIEPLALKFLAEETGQTLRRSATRTCEAHPWSRARPDALVVADLPQEEDVARLLRRAPLGPKGARKAKANAVCEVKFVSDPRMAQLWILSRPRPPAYVHVQAQAEMTACKLRRACGIGIVMGNPYIWELEHDAELEAEILAIGENFLKTHVDAKVPPSWDGSKAANRLLMARWPVPDETFRKADLNMHGLARVWLDSRKGDRDQDEGAGHRRAGAEGFHRRPHRPAGRRVEGDMEGATGRVRGLEGGRPRSGWPQGRLPEGRRAAPGCAIAPVQAVRARRQAGCGRPGIVGHGPRRPARGNRRELTWSPSRSTSVRSARASCGRSSRATAKQRWRGPSAPCCARSARSASRATCPACRSRPA